jgi:predicted MFS family arabinose efflux permease
MSRASTSSTSGSNARSSAKAPRLALWSLLIGNLFIGTGFQMPVGILHLIAEAQAVSVARAGALMWAGGIILAIGAPAMAWVTSRIDRRKLLIWSLLSTVFNVHSK